MSILVLSAMLLAASPEPAAPAQQPATAQKKKTCTVAVVTGSRASRPKTCKSTRTKRKDNTAEAQDRPAEGEDRDALNNMRVATPTNSPGT